MKKGDWVGDIHPVVNELCKEYGLSIQDIEVAAMSLRNGINKRWYFNKVIQRSAAWQEHTRIVKGNPVRIYDGEKFVLREQQE